MSTRPLPGDPPYLRAALSKLGLSEIAGSQHEPQVLAMYAACGHPEVKRDEVAWCAAYVGWALVQGDLPTSQPISKNLLAASYLTYPGKKYTKHDTIPRGAICVWPRDAGSGHVNFALEDLDDKVLCIGGNQGNGRGGGVTIVKYPKSELRAAVLPKKPAVVPKPPPPPDIEPPEEEPTKPIVQSTEIWSQLLTIITTIASVVTDIRFLLLIVFLFCAYQIWKRYERGDLKGWFRRKP